jgi:hypothetical protein
VTREFAAGSRGRGGEMGFVGDTVESIRSMQIRQVLMQIISLGDALCPSLLFFSPADCFFFPRSWRSDQCVRRRVVLRVCGEYFAMRN